MSGKIIRYIIAEDEPPIRKNLIKKISSLAPDFTLAGQASGGKTALKLVKSENPHIIFTDIRMPGIDGLELMNTLSNYYPQIIIVVISGYNDFEYAQNSIRLGASDYLLKPINPEQLNKTLNRIRKELEQKDQFIDKNIDWYEDKAGTDMATKTAEIIQKQFRENLSVQEIAETLKVNATYLSRVFKSIYDITPSRYIQIQRMDLAKRLLMQYMQMEIKEIAAFVGYSDQNYFSRFFKKETGMSPIEYRDSQKFS